MIIGVPREIKADEYRVAMVPAGVEILTRAGHTVVVEAGAGLGSGVADEEYATAEAEFLLSRNRFNVAATRAERKLVVFCSDTVLDLVPTDRKVLMESMMLKEFRHYCSDGHARVL